MYVNCPKIYYRINKDISITNIGSKIQWKNKGKKELIKKIGSKAHDMFKSPKAAKIFSDKKKERKKKLTK